MELDREPGPDGSEREGGDRVRLDGRAVRHMLEHATTWLEHHVGVVNALNVFPVPDGDTGTNMHLTMRAAIDAMRRAADEGAGAVIRAAAQGAVLGARGNSGVILSQIVSGLAKGVGDSRTVSPAELARALTEGSIAAYRAVTRPVEGTILSVAHAAGESAVARLAQASVTVGTVITAAIDGAREAVRATPSQLPILRQAGVVDAGGEGYRLILEGMAYAIRGEALPNGLSSTPAVDRSDANVVSFDFVNPADDPLADEWGYCTQFVIMAPVGVSLRLAEVEAELRHLAESTIVVGGDGFVRVHGHTEDPGALLTRAVNFGRVHRISIEDMDEQVARWRAQNPSNAELALPTRPLSPVAYLAVVPGEGFAAVFRDLGVHAVVVGGQTMNPSAQEIIDGVRSAHAKVTIVLPNNGNIVLTARQAATLATQALGADREIVVIPSRTVPQGVAAMMATGVDDPAGLDALVAAMSEAIANVRTVEITRATRDVVLDGVSVRMGDVLGLVDDILVEAGHDIQAIAIATLTMADVAAREIVTMYWGAEVTEAEARSMQAVVEVAFRGIAVQALPGGQAHYDYIMSVE